MAEDRDNKEGFRNFPKKERDGGGLIPSIFELGPGSRNEVPPILIEDGERPETKENAPSMKLFYPQRLGNMVNGKLFQ